MTLFAPPSCFLEACDALHLSLDEVSLKKFSIYLELLLNTNRRMNLTAIRDVDKAWMRHVYDSLLLLSFLPATGRLMDVGSGGGLPGIPLAICCPDISFTLLETTEKKANFLKQVKTALELDHVHIVNMRAETAGHDAVYREQFDRVTARAVAPLRILLELTVPFLKSGALLLAMKGRTAQQELTDAQHAMDVLGVTTLNAHALGANGAMVLEMLKTRPMDEAYPRRPGMPGKRPL